MTEQQKYEVSEILREIIPEDRRPTVDEFLEFLHNTLAKCQQEQLETVRNHFLN